MRIDSGRVEGVRRAAAADGDDLAREVVAQEQPDDLRGDDLRASTSDQSATAASGY